MAQSSNKQIRIIIDGLESDAEQAIKKLTLDVVANLVKAPSEGGTPVDTGWARANWFANIGVPVTEAAPNPNESGATVAATGEREARLGGVLSYKLASGPVFISNNVPYILRLNEGTSKQAPAGFVQKAIQKAITQLRSVA